MGENSNSSLRPVAEGGVEVLSPAVFDLYFNVRNAVRCTTFVYRFKQGSSDAAASCFRTYVEVFDAGEATACRDVQTVGENENTDDTVFCQGGKYLHVSALDGHAQSFGEIFGDRFAVSEGFFQEREWYGEVLCGDDLDRVHPQTVLVVILAAASTAVCMSSSATSRWVHSRT